MSGQFVLTILTKPPLSSGTRGGVRRRLGNVYRYIRHKFSNEKELRERGPGAVRMNLLKGLNLIRQSYRLNPPESLVTSHVGVLSNVEALRWAIKAKQEGKIKYLAAGPNLVVLPNECDRILESEAIDRVIVPSEWVKNKYISVSPCLKSRMAIWPTGVDETYWRPCRKPKRDMDFLIYNKNNEPELMEEIIAELTRRNLSYEIISYGNYLCPDYKRLLCRSRAMLFLSWSEAAPIAIFEAWSCNVPTLAWDRGYWKYLDDETIQFPASSVPFLTGDCGLSFRGAGDFKEKLSLFMANINRYKPRETILQKYTLRRQAEAYMAIICEK